MKHMNDDGSIVDLDENEEAVLLYLCRNPGAGLRQVADAFAMTDREAALMAKSLCDKGLIKLRRTDHHEAN